MFFQIKIFISILGVKVESWANFGIEKFSTFKCGGKIKEQPEDFIVEEVQPDKEICTITTQNSMKDSSTGEKEEYLHFTLVKKNYTTHRAISKIADYLRMSRKRFSFAGTKDKRAITAQRVCLWNGNIKNMITLELKDLLVKNFQYAAEKLTLGDLYGNRFTISIREPENPEEIEKIRSTLEHGIKNYFGPQRFGAIRPTNHLIGKYLILGEFEKAAKIFITSPGDNYTNIRQFAKRNWRDWRDILNKWPKILGVEAALLNYLVNNPKDFRGAFRELPKNLRLLFVHAFQSYIFNLTLSRIESLPSTIPIVGYWTKLKGEVGELIKKLLQHEGISRRDFRCFEIPELASKGTQRKAKIVPENFKIFQKNDEVVKIQFILKKGAYATIILKKLGVKIL